MVDRNNTAGKFAQLAAPQMLVIFVAAPVNMVITLCGRQKTQLAWELFQFAMLMTTWAVISLLKLTPLAAVGLQTIAIMIVYSTYLWMADGVTRNSMMLNELCSVGDIEGIGS